MKCKFRHKLTNFALRRDNSLSSVTLQNSPCLQGFCDRLILRREYAGFKFRWKINPSQIYWFDAELMTESSKFHNGGWYLQRNKSSPILRR